MQSTGSSTRDLRDQLEDIAATRTKPLAAGHGAHHARQLGNSGAGWGEAQVLYALDPYGRTSELIQLPHKTGSTSWHAGF